MTNLIDGFPLPSRYLGGVNKQKLLYDRVALLAQISGVDIDEFWDDFVKWSKAMPYTGLECADILKGDVLAGSGVPWRATGNQ